MVLNRKKGSQVMSFNLYMVRHGQTFFNKYERMQGWADAPLTNQGVADGYSAGARLNNIRFSGAYSSDLTRAVRTAEEILERNRQSKGLTEPTQLFQFREVFFGFFEGLPSDQSGKMVSEAINQPEMSYAELMQNIPYNEVLDGFRAADPTDDAEDAETFLARLDNGLDILRREHRDGDNVLLVAHGSLIRNMAARYADPALAGQKITNGAVTLWEVDDENIELKVYNDNERNW